MVLSLFRARLEANPFTPYLQKSIKPLFQEVLGKILRYDAQLLIETPCHETENVRIAQSPGYGVSFHIVDAQSNDVSMVTELAEQVTGYVSIAGNKRILRWFNSDCVYNDSYHPSYVVNHVGLAFCTCSHNGINTTVSLRFRNAAESLPYR